MPFPEHIITITNPDRDITIAVILIAYIITGIVIYFKDIDSK